MSQIVIIGNAILKQKDNFFSIDRIVKDTGLERLQVLKYLEELSRDGIIKRARKCERCWQEREKIQDSLLMIFRADKKKLAARIAPKLKNDTVMDKMWSVIRNKSKVDGCFTIRDLLCLAEAKRENARTFLKMLRRGGFIIPSKQSGVGVEWRLIKDPGPRRPYVGDQKNR